MAIAQKTRKRNPPLQQEEETFSLSQGTERYSDLETETETETESELGLESDSQARFQRQRQRQSARKPQTQQQRGKQPSKYQSPERGHRKNSKALQPFERIQPPEKSMKGPVTYAREMRGELSNEGESNADQLQSQDKENGDESGLKLRLDLNLDIEIELKASIHGDVTLSLLS